MFRTPEIERHVTRIRRIYATIEDLKGFADRYEAHIMIASDEMRIGCDAADAAAQKNLSSADGMLRELKSMLSDSTNAWIEKDEPVQGFN